MAKIASQTKRYPCDLIDEDQKRPQPKRRRPGFD